MYLLVLCQLFLLAESVVHHSIYFIHNVTTTLDSLLLSNYDKRIRPDFGGPATQVSVNMHIKSIGPVSENEETYNMDVYFRQSWCDRRLRFNLSGVSEFSMSWLFLDKIWKPDTFFLNGKRSHLHRITSPNKFVRVRHDGHLTYSMRLTISATCKMHLRKFPLDSQICSLLIGSYGYSSQELTYLWSESSVGLEPGVEMAQYEIVNITTRQGLTVYRAQDPYSVVEAKFKFRRSIGYFVLQIYVPCSLIVCCSWISFWITPSDVAGRTTLAVTTVLSITTLGFGGRAQLPKVSHATALDYFVIICFTFSFAVMVEYAVINFTDKLAADIKLLLEERSKKKSLNDKKEGETMEESMEGGARPALVTEPTMKTALDGHSGYRLLPNRWFSLPSLLSTHSVTERPDWMRGTSDVVVQPSRTAQALDVLKAPLRVWRGLHFLPRDMDLESEQRFHQIDILARRVFPVAFLLMIATYSGLYSFYITDQHEQ